MNTLLGELDGLKAQFEAIDQALAASGSLLSLSGGVVMDNPYALACCNGSEADTLQAAADRWADRRYGAYHCE